MKRTIAILVAGLVAIALGGLAIAGVNRNFSVHAKGALERPVAVVTDAQGQAIFHLSKDGQSLSYKLIVANIENVTQAHIHIGQPHEAGGVIAWLYPSGPPAMLIPGRTQGVLAQGTITSADLVGALSGQPLSALLTLMRNQGAYVNVHTTQFPAGEVRGNFR